MFRWISCIVPHPPTGGGMGCGQNTPESIQTDAAGVPRGTDCVAQSRKVGRRWVRAHPRGGTRTGRVAPEIQILATVSPTPGRRTPAKRQGARPPGAGPAPDPRLQRDGGRAKARGDGVPRFILGWWVPLTLLEARGTTSLFGWCESAPAELSPERPRGPRGGLGTASDGRPSGVYR